MSTLIKTTMIIGIVTVILFSGFFVFVKTRGNERTGDKLAMQDDSVAYETEDGKMTAGKDIPSDWPSDAPLYPRATVEFSEIANILIGDGGTAVVLLSPADLQEVKNYYKTELPDQGWTVKNTMEAQGSVIYLAEKEGRTMSVTVTGTDGAVQISLGLQMKQS